MRYHDLSLIIFVTFPPAHPEKEEHEKREERGANPRQKNTQGPPATNGICRDARHCGIIRRKELFSKHCCSDALAEHHAGRICYRLIRVRPANAVRAPRSRGCCVTRRGGSSFAIDIS